MDTSLRIVIALPLTELWTDSGPLQATRIRDLNREQIREMLRVEAVQFVIADAGERLEWIPAEETFRRWREDIDIHLVEGDEISRDDFPDSKAYVSSEWRDWTTGNAIVLCEVYH